MSGNSQSIIFDFSHQNAGAYSVIVSYKHFELNYSTLQTLFDSHPVLTLEDTNFGDLLLTTQNTLRVAILIYPSEFIFVKIDILACTHEHAFTNCTLLVLSPRL